MSTSEFFPPKAKLKVEQYTGSDGKPNALLFEAL